MNIAKQRNTKQRKVKPHTENFERKQRMNKETSKNSSRGTDSDLQLGREKITATETKDQPTRE